MRKRVCLIKADFKDVMLNFLESDFENKTFSMSFPSYLQKSFASKKNIMPFIGVKSQQSVVHYIRIRKIEITEFFCK